MADGRYPRRSPAQWQGLIERQAASGLSQAAFCAREGAAVSSFQYWKHRLRQAPAARAMARRSSRRPMKGQGYSHRWSRRRIPMRQTSPRIRLAGSSSSSSATGCDCAFVGARHEGAARAVAVLRAHRHAPLSGQGFVFINRR